MGSNPYQSQPDSAFWSRAVSKGFNSEKLINPNEILLNKKDKVTSAGSCFASNLIPYIESAGLTYIRTEQMPKIFADLGENLGYANFSANYGNIYTPRQLVQLYKRTLGHFKPEEDRWRLNGEIIDPFRPGLKFNALSNEEFDFLTTSHLKATKTAFESADVLVFTFGLTEGWVSALDGSTYPACPGTISGTFDPKKYKFHNFELNEIISDMSEFIELLRANNPKVRFILTVSPVPLVATATNHHVLTATTYSKSVLRVAAEKICQNIPGVHYFPAYELITGPQAPDDYFEADRRNVSAQGVEMVMKTLLETSGLKAKEKKIFASKPKEDLNNKIYEISKRITVAECDEVMLDERL